MNLIDRIRFLFPFWFASSLYFLIPFIRNPIDAPQAFIYFDSLIPFIWWMIIPYYLYYIALFMPLLINDEIFLEKFVRLSLILLFISYTIFIIWPISCKTVMNSIENNPLDFLYGAVEIPWLKQNALPSVHVTISIFIALVLGEWKPKYRMIFLVCGFSIFFSTFFAKQHFIADSISGLLLSAIGYFFWKRF